MLYCIFDLLFFIVVKSHLIIERIKMRKITLWLIFLSILSCNVSAKTALPDTICQPDDKENICQFVINEGVGGVMINGSIVRTAKMNNSIVSTKQYYIISIEKKCNKDLSVMGSYDKDYFYVTDIYCQNNEN
jgi:hypothetical protein